MQNVKLIYNCDLNMCNMASNRDNCYGSDICDQCRLCTSDGMVITKVKREGIIYEVSGVSADEFILYSRNPKRLCSISPNTAKFTKEFEIIETEYDRRKGYYYY